MRYAVKDEGDYAIVVLDGDVDLSCSPEVRKAVLACLAEARHTLVDLSAVTYIDSSGVASLVEGFQTARKKSLRFGLIRVSDEARSVLELAHLDKIFPIHADLAARRAADG